MFGKINFGFGSNLNKNNNLQNNSAINKPETNANQSNKKSFLSNPKFVPIVKNQQNDNKTNMNKNSKTFQDEGHKNNNKNSNMPQKTKQIYKNNAKSKQKSNNNNFSIENQMQGSKFRILNQILYTSSSADAMKHFEQHPQDYETYHQGYSFQAQKWQTKPVNVIIKYFRKNYKDYKNKVICDLGCGQGFLYEELTNKTFKKFINEGQRGSQQNKKFQQVKNKHAFDTNNIHSFDLVSLKPFIKIADIKNLPVQKQSADVVVFCLSLMGKNYLEFIQQAWRILKPQTGQLIIAEVQSRSKNWKNFAQMIQWLGFQLVNNGVSLGSGTQFNQTDNKKVAQNKGRYFRIFHFIKNENKSKNMKKIRFEDKSYTKDNLEELSKLLLTECIYKKR